jgi:hypothetical protein
MNILESKKVVVYDGGEDQIDRYTVVIGDEFYSMSENPDSPIGVNQFLGDSSDGYKEGKHLGKKLSKIPNSLKKAIKERQ